MTSKGQITIPKAVRRALRLSPGTRVTFQFDELTTTMENSATGRLAQIQTYPDFFSLGGSVDVPDAVREDSWADLRRRARGRQIGRSQHP